MKPIEATIKVDAEVRLAWLHGRHRAMTDPRTEKGTP